ncbi:MAG: chromate transporter [Ruminococcaceae bacterium]|nr:chromate transporter [Oscillospiraceae bacterium]MBQ9914178.1 chromate transporter [Clostridia bacterium]
MIFLELFFRFFFVGLFSVGGGLATLPFLTDMSEVTGWFTQTDISNMIAISESTPGPIGINMATYVGFQTGEGIGGFAGGLLGALVAPLGLTAPALIVVLAISRVLLRFRSSKYVEWVFYGLRAASLGLIASACLGVAKIAFFSSEAFAQGADFFAAVDYKSIILSVLIFFGITKFKKIHPIVFILIAAAVGIVFRF